MIDLVHNLIDTEPDLFDLDVDAFQFLDLGRVFLVFSGTSVSIRVRSFQ